MSAPRTAKERAEELCIRLGYYYPDLIQAITKSIEESVSEEREACLKIVISHAEEYDNGCNPECIHDCNDEPCFVIADEIRARQERE